VTTAGARDKPGSLAEVGDSMAALADALLDHGVGLTDAMQAFEARYVRAAIARHDGNLSQAAATLGVHRNTLRWKMRRDSNTTRLRSH
jgi:DNA-binding NtrC family response regulator